MNFKLSEEAMNKTNKRTTTNDSKLNKTVLFQCKNCTWPHADWRVRFGASEALQAHAVSNNEN